MNSSTNCLSAYLLFQVLHLLTVYAMCGRCQCAIISAIDNVLVKALEDGRLSDRQFIDFLRAHARLGLPISSPIVSEASCMSSIAAI